MVKGCGPGTGQSGQIRRGVPSPVLIRSYQGRVPSPCPIRVLSCGNGAGQGGFPPGKSNGAWRFDGVGCAPLSSYERSCRSRIFGEVWRCGRSCLGVRCVDVDGAQTSPPPTAHALPSLLYPLHSTTQLPTQLLPALLSTLYYSKLFTTHTLSHRLTSLGTRLS